MKTLCFLCLIFISTSVMAAMPVCRDTHGGFCGYTGKVERIYINSGGKILLYFDTPMPVENALTAGLTITKGSAGIIVISHNPEFAKLFYSTALAAQASKRNVTIQMRDTNSGYLLMDRIWLAE